MRMPTLNNGAVHNFQYYITLFLPSLLSLFISFWSIVLSIVLHGKVDWLNLPESILCAVALCAMPAANLFFDQRFPLWLNYFALIFIVISENLGIFLGFYELFPLWDLLAHGICGVFFGVLFTVILYQNKGDILPKPIFVLLIALTVIGVGGAWEVHEYWMDILLGTDGQKVAESIQAGLSPLADTMEDVIITAFGVFSWLAVFLLDKRVEKKLKQYHSK